MEIASAGGLMRVSFPSGTAPGGQQVGQRRHRGRQGNVRRGDLGAPTSPGPGEISLAGVRGRRLSLRLRRRGRLGGRIGSLGKAQPHSPRGRPQRSPALTHQFHRREGNRYGLQPGGPLQGAVHPRSEDLHGGLRHRSAPVLRVSCRASRTRLNGSRRSASAGICCAPSSIRTWSDAWAS